MIRQHAPIARSQLVEPLPSIAAQGLVAQYTLAKQQAFDPVDVLNPFGNQYLALAAETATVLFFGSGRFDQRTFGGPTMDESWKSDLERWLAPFISALGHKTRARMCPAYVAGLIGAGDRKSVPPMAARDGDVGCDQLHHFIASGVWDAAPLEKALLIEADKMVGGADAWLIIDDTALPKKGAHSVGVAPQYASSLRKTANCHSLVSLTLASREVPVMVGLRLFLPESWTDDPERMAQARVPQDRQVALSKPEIAIEEIDRVMASSVRFGRVLADSGYGSSGPFFKR
jgi:SRSO17 transposase